MIGTFTVPVTGIYNISGSYMSFNDTKYNILINRAKMRGIKLNKNNERKLRKALSDVIRVDVTRELNIDVSNVGDGIRRVK
jgi:hypothetical protein